MEKVLEQILNELKELKTRQERLEGILKNAEEHLADKIDDLRGSSIKDWTSSNESFNKVQEKRDVGIQSRLERYSRTRPEEITEKQDSEDKQTTEQTSEDPEEDIQQEEGLSGLAADKKVADYLSDPKKKELRNLVNSVVPKAHDLFPGRRITLEIRGELLFLEIEGKDEKDIENLQKLNSMSSSFEEFIIDLDFQ